jgi:HSP20 family molecular chaperone IbpA
MADAEKSLQVEKEEIAPEEGAEWAQDRRMFIPRADIYETKDQIVVVVDMPGAREDQIDITLEKNVLTLHADVEQDNLEGYSLLLTEYEVGDYQRSFKLPDEVNQERIEATYAEGVLRLFLPKAEAAKAKKIMIKTA